MNQDSPPSTARIPGLNRPAPDCRAPTMDGEKQLVDYQGQWRGLFSHPSPGRATSTSKEKFGVGITLPIIAAAEKCVHEGYECVDGYCCKKQVA